MNDTETPLVENPLSLEWTITYKDHSFRLEDVTGEHLMNLSIMLGDSWTAMTPLSGPLSLMSFISVMTATATGQELTEVFDELKALKAEEILNLISVSPLN